MLKLKTLKFKNIGRFTEEQTISFDSLGNLVQVDAQNNNTGGSSGSGKSTIFNALDWLLGLSDLSTTVLQSRLTKENISVTGTFDWDGKETVIHRAKKLSIVVDGNETLGASKLTEELLDQIIGMPRNLFRPLLHKKQGEQGFFLQMTPSQMNSFLTDCLGLTTIRSKIDLIDQKTKDLLSAKTKAQSDLQAALASLEATKSAILSLGQEPTTNVTEEMVKESEGKLKLAQIALETVKSSHKLELVNLESAKPKAISVPFDKTHLNAIESEIKAVEAQISLVLDGERNRQVQINKSISAIKLETNNQISSLRLEHSNKVSEHKAKLAQLTNITQVGKASKEAIIKLSGQIKIQKSGICHTCQQSWITEQAKKEEQRLLDELAKHKTNLEASIKASEEITALEATLPSLNENYNKVVKELTDGLNSRVLALTEQAKPQTPSELPDLNEKSSILHGKKIEERAKEDAHNLAQNEENSKVMNAFIAKQMVLVATHKEQIEAVNKDAQEARSAYEQNKNTFDSWNKSLERYKNSLLMLKATESSTTSKVDDITLKVSELSDSLNIAEEIKRCIKSYLSCSFDDALDSISDSSTRILRSVPTMANATIRLNGTRETAAGAIKETITACLDNDGELDVPIKSLSGGERSAVDLAVDLAVCEMIQEKANKGIDIMILDEPFNGFDSIGIEQALEILRTFSTNKRILIVEHDSVAKEFIQDRITVVRDGENSRIK